MIKLWDLSSQTLLTTFLFPGPIECLAFENVERTFFASSSGGKVAELAGVVYQVNLFRSRDTDRELPGIEALGGGGSAEAIRLDSNPKHIIPVRCVLNFLCLYILRVNNARLPIASSRMLTYPIGSLSRPLHSPLPSRLCSLALRQARYIFTMSLHIN